VGRRKRLYFHFFTDKDQHAVALLKQQIVIYSLGPRLLRLCSFECPDLLEIIENHTLGMITTTRRDSYNSIGLCGSPTLVKETHQLKINGVTVVAAAVTGNKRYHMDSVSDSYGGVKRRDTKNAGKQDLPSTSDCDDTQQESHLDAKLDCSSFVAS
jgi:hypothetical protein